MSSPADPLNPWSNPSASSSSSSSVQHDATTLNEEATLPASTSIISSTSNSTLAASRMMLPGEMRTETGSGMGIDRPMDDFDDDDTHVDGPIAADDSIIASSVPVVATAATEGQGEDQDEGANEDEDDDFDDFGDFDTADPSSFAATSFDLPSFPSPSPPPSPSTLSPPSSLYPALKINLAERTAAALRSQEGLCTFLDLIFAMNKERERDLMTGSKEPEGGDVLHGDLRNALISLSSLPSVLKPVDWRRSRIRREHLIALGVPVNLDDSAESKPLASLVLPSQLPLPSSSSSSPSFPSSFSQNDTSSASAGRQPLASSSSFSYTPSASSRPSTPSRRTTIAPPPPAAPVVDLARATALALHPAEELRLMSCAELRLFKPKLDQCVAQIGEGLEWALRVREKEVGDGEVYQRLIQDLVLAATAMKTSSRSTSGSTNASVVSAAHGTSGSGTAAGGGGGSSRWSRK